MSWQIAAAKPLRFASSFFLSTVIENISNLPTWIYQLSWKYWPIYNFLTVFFNLLPTSPTEFLPTRLLPTRFFQLSWKYWSIVNFPTVLVYWLLCQLGFSNWVGNIDQFLIFQLYFYSSDYLFQLCFSNWVENINQFLIYQLYF